MVFLLSLTWFLGCIPRSFRGWVDKRQLFKSVIHGYLDARATSFFTGLSLHTTPPFEWRWLEHPILTASIVWLSQSLLVSQV
jgi:hypothetical protein